MIENMKKYKELAAKYGYEVTEADFENFPVLSDDELSEVTGGCDCELKRELESVRIDLKNLRDFYATASMPIRPGSSAARMPSACVWLPGEIAKLEAREKELLAALSE